MSMPNSKRLRRSWRVPVSKMAENTFNPIRNIVESMNLTPHPDKPMISLSIGDPTVFGNLPVAESCLTALIESTQKQAYNGYAPSVGFEFARQAVADYVTTSTSRVEAKDVILASGCSGALDLCISCLANPGQNILVPRPGFSLYKTLGDSLGVEVRHYNLLPSKSWQVDLEHLESLVDENTAAAIVCNPSNPCGSVYSLEHLLEIIHTLDRNRIPIIADEIYEHFVFTGSKYHSMASLSEHVPILSCGGLTKRFLVPGWRLGWIVINDRQNILSEVRTGLVKLSQRILGPNTLVQAAMPDILKKTPQSFFDDTLKYIENNARQFYEHIRQVPGLHAVMPQGAMYMMVGIDMDFFPDFVSDVDFTERLVAEESVFCLPATCFQYPNFFRIVLTVPTDKVTEACERIKLFCERHFKSSENINSEFEYHTKNQLCKSPVNTTCESFFDAEK